MQITATDKTILTWTGNTLAIGVGESEIELTGDLAHLNNNLSGAIAEIIAEENWQAKSGTIITTRLGGNSKIRKLILVGLGKTEEIDRSTIGNATAAIARAAKSQKTTSLGISLPLVEDAANTAEIITESLHLTLHQDNRFKSEIKEEEKLQLETVELLGLTGTEASITKAEQIASGVILARELVSAPPNVIKPENLAHTAQEIAQEYGLKVEILEKSDCEKLGMGAFLGVAMASDLPPKFIHLTYKPTGTIKRKLAIVGKGITFDSGGLNLKVGGSGIETMKMDMGGAGATLGAAKAIAQIKPDVEVHFISAVTENMISGHAMHPGDILTASNGKTIEVNNTDAEGRLTLADALVFAEKLGVDAIIDLATLTGACIVALGNDISGFWSTDENLTTEIKTAGEQAGEKFWQMPLEKKYFEGLKSPIADMKNTGPRAGGAITAALFLQEFVKDTPWAHLDIAGPVWTDKDNGVNNSGATGFPVRTLVNWVINS